MNPTLEPSNTFVVDMVEYDVESSNFGATPTLIPKLWTMISGWMLIPRTTVSTFGLSKAYCDDSGLTAKSRSNHKTLRMAEPEFSVSAGHQPYKRSGNWIVSPTPPLNGVQSITQVS
jgi:hypothetical protein